MGDDRGPEPEGVEAISQERDDLAKLLDEAIDREKVREVDLERAQEFSLTVEERQAILVAVEFYLTSHDGRHEDESGATHSGYAKLVEALAEARERHPAEGQPGPWPGSVYNADGVAVYRADARERGEQ